MNTSGSGVASVPIHALKAREVAASVLGGALSACEVAAAMNARIAALDPLLNAFVDHRPADVLEAASAVDARIAAGERPPLAGVPFTVKDNLWLGGRPATFGSRLFEGFVAPRDSWCVARLRALGAVPLGVTACSEFACKGVTNTPLHGRTLNPWDTSRTPGGSSGGAVAAVAAGLGPLALATDAGGSTRRPAAHTGLVGMKPTLGYVPNPWGFDDPNHLLSVIGQVGRDVEDCALMLDVLAGFDGRDPLSQPVFATARVGDALKAQRPAWRVAVAAVLIGDIGAGCLSNFTASTNGFYAARPGLRWSFIAVHGHLVAVAWALSWPLAPAIGLWAWTIGSASVVNLLEGRPAQRFVAGALFATSLLSTLVFTMPAAMQVVAALFTLKVAYAFAVRHER